jgi:hypothetical protein
MIDEPKNRHPYQKTKTYRHKTIFYPKQYPAIKINIVNPVNHK